MMTGHDELQRRIRRNALLLGGLALAFYAGYYLLQLAQTAP
jgi:hypothetical protein